MRDLSDDTLELLCRWIIVTGLAAIGGLIVASVVMTIMFITGNACR